MSDQTGQGKAVHRPHRHVDIGHQDTDIGTVLEHVEGPVGMGCFQDVEPRFRERIGGFHQQQSVIFNEEDDGQLCRVFCHEPANDLGPTLVAGLIRTRSKVKEETLRDCAEREKAP